MRVNAQLTIDTTDPTKLMPSYILPRDQDAFDAVWWRISDAAEAWQCDFSTAKRLIDRYPKKVGRCVVWLVTMRGASARVVIPKDTPRPEVRRGNPRFGRRGRQDQEDVV